MIDYQSYCQAVIVTGDGDFYCLVNHLLVNDKLKALIVPNRHKYSALLKLREIKPYARDMNDLRKKLAYQGDKKKNPHKYATLQGKSSIGDGLNIAHHRLNANTTARNSKPKGKKL